MYEKHIFELIEKVLLAGIALKTQCVIRDCTDSHRMQEHLRIAAMG